MELFASLYLDEDVPVLLASLLRSHGFDVETAVEAGMLACSDEDHLEYATQNKRVLVTHNRRHFEQLQHTRLETNRRHYGIVLARRRPTEYELAKRLYRLLNALTQDEWMNQLIYA